MLEDGGEGVNEESIHQSIDKAANILTAEKDSDDSSSAKSSSSTGSSSSSSSSGTTGSSSSSEASWSPQYDVDLANEDDTEHARPVNNYGGGCRGCFRSVIYAPRDFVEWVRFLCRTFGFKFIFMLFLVQHVTKGFVGGGGASGLVGLPAPYLYKQLGVDAARVQTLRAVSASPWSLKSAIGFTSDVFPIYGYNKSPYIVIVTVAALFAYAILGFGWPMSAELMTGLLFIMMFQIATSDLLTEAKYAEKLKQHPKHGPALMSFVWGGIFLFQMLTSVIAGELVEYKPEASYLVCILPVAMLLPFTIKGWLGETRAAAPNQRQCIRADVNKVRQQKKLFALSVIISAVSLITSIMGIADVPGYIEGPIIGVLAICVLIGFYKLTEPVIFKVQTFFFVQHICTLSIESATFYFFTNTPEQYPEGPHFSPMFYVTGVGLVSSAFSVVGIMLYNKYMKNWKYRTVFMGTNILFMCVNLSMVLVYTRANLSIGIPDTVFFLGSDVFVQIVQQWTWIPGIVILSQLCPDGVEATMYAILAGTQNLGSSLGAYLGAFLLKSLDITPKGEPNESAAFDNLWIAAVISTVLPCVPLLLVRVLIPDARQTDRLLPAGRAAAASRAGGVNYAQLDEPGTELGDLTVTLHNDTEDDHGETSEST